MTARQDGTVLPRGTRDGTAPPAPTPDAPDAWHRVHPLTPFVRSWLLLVALAWGIGHTFVEDVVSALIKGEPVEVDVDGALQVVGAGLLIAVLCGVLGLLIGLGLLSWWFTRYQITDQHVRFRSGWLFRTQRQARLDRVQGIDIERRFLPRILGLASLKFDVADGGSSVLELSYLGRDHARQLREQLLVAAHEAADDAAGRARAAAGAAASSPGTTTGAAAGPMPRAAGEDSEPFPVTGSATVPPEGLPVENRADGTGRAVAPWALPAHQAQGTRAAASSSSDTDREATGRDGTDPRGTDRDRVDVRVARRHGLLGEQDELRRVFTVPTLRVVLSLVCSPPAVVLAVMVVAAVVAWRVYPDALVVVVPSFLPMLLAVVSGLYSRTEKSWGFTLSEVPSGARTRAGLFNERSSTIPTGRVQALQVTRPLLWRFFDGHRVTVTTAGKGDADDAAGLGSLVVPVGTAEQVREILELVLPVQDAPVELVTEGLRGIGGEGRFTTSPRRARWLDPLTWRRTGFALDDSCLVLRRGRLTRRTSVVPHHKTQSSALRQGPLERRLGLSGFAVHVTAGSVVTSVHHLDVAQARELQWHQSELARAARERSGGRHGDVAAEDGRANDARGSGTPDV